MFRLVYFVFLVLFFQVFPVKAEEELWLGSLKTEQLEKIYDFYGYDGERGYLMLPKYHYPRLFLTTFPDDFAQIEDEERRKVLFIKIVTPLAMRLHEELLKEREKIKEIEAYFKKNQELTKAQEEYVEAQAVHYDIFSRLQGYQRLHYLITELLKRVDGMPPSFLVATAAIETNWGKSRLVKDGNALYRLIEWHTDEGLVPQDDELQEDYRIKVYPDIYSSMRDFAHRLNSNINYEPFWDFRREMRRRNAPLLGHQLSHTLFRNSYLKNYGGLLEYTIAFYEMLIIDKSVLDAEMVGKELPANFKNLVKKGNK